MKLVEDGIAVPSCSPWASPIVPVPKKDGSVRICVDYQKRLNEITVGDPFYMVTLEEILEKVGGAQVMSKLDLSQRLLSGGSGCLGLRRRQPLCVLLENLNSEGCPFGLKNAPALFQRCMEVVLHSCYRFSAPYIDDVLIFSENPEDHAVHLRQVLLELRHSGMTVKESKCSVWHEEDRISWDILLGVVSWLCPSTGLLPWQDYKIAQDQESS